MRRWSKSQREEARIPNQRNGFRGPRCSTDWSNIRTTTLSGWDDQPVRPHPEALHTKGSISAERNAEELPAQKCNTDPLAILGAYRDGGRDSLRERELARRTCDTDRGNAVRHNRSQSFKPEIATVDLHNIQTVSLVTNASSCYSLAKNLVAPGWRQFLRRLPSCDEYRGVRSVPELVHLLVFASVVGRLGEMARELDHQRQVAVLLTDEARKWGEGPDRVRAFSVPKARQRPRKRRPWDSARHWGRAVMVSLGLESNTEPERRRALFRYPVNVWHKCDLGRGSIAGDRGERAVQ